VSDKAVSEKAVSDKAVSEKQQTNTTTTTTTMTTPIEKQEALNPPLHDNDAATGSSSSGTKNITTHLPLDLLAHIFRMASNMDPRAQKCSRMAGVRNYPNLMPRLNRATSRFHALNKGERPVFLILLQNCFSPEKCRNSLPASLFLLPPSQQEKDFCIHIFASSVRNQLRVKKEDAEPFDPVRNHNDEVGLLDIDNYAWELVALLEALGPELRARVTRIALPMLLPMIISITPGIATVRTDRQEYIARTFFGGHNMFATLSQRTRLEGALSADYLPRLTHFSVIVQGYAHSFDLDAFRRASQEHKAVMCENTLMIQQAIYVSGWAPIAQALRHRTIDTLCIMHNTKLHVEKFYKSKSLKAIPQVVTPLRWAIQLASDITTVITEHESPVKFSPFVDTMERFRAVMLLDSWPEHHRTYVRHIYIETPCWLHKVEESKPLWVMLAAAGVEHVELRVPDAKHYTMTFRLSRAPSHMVRLTSHTREQLFPYHYAIQQGVINWLEVYPPITEEESTYIANFGYFFTG